jgi:hypothetical protein
MTLAPLVEPVDDALDAFIEHSKRFPIKKEARQQLIRAATGFHAAHRDFAAWMSTAIANSPQAAIGIPQGRPPQFPRDGHEKSPRTAMVSPHGRPRELPAGSLTANR